MLTIVVGPGAALASGSGSATAQEGTAASGVRATAAELAKQLQYPIAALISVPFQNNADGGAGAGSGQLAGHLGALQSGRGMREFEQGYVWGAKTKFRTR